jgi:4-hydroxybenzoate polyprenyltransferase
MAALQIAIGALNDYVDLVLDQHTKPWKPLVRGDLYPRTAVWLTILGLSAGVLVVAPLGSGVVALAIIGAGAGMIYNLYLKRTIWSWLPYLVALPLLPIWVWTAVRGWDGRLLLLYPLGALMVVGLHVADTLPDIQSDTAHGIKGFAHRMGEQRAMLLCWLCSLLPPPLAIGAAAVGLADLHVVALAAICSLLLTATAIAYFLLARRWDWRLHFALLATATIILAGGWLLALH